MGITYQSYLYKVKYSKGYLSYNFKYICMCNLITIVKLSNTIHSQDHKFPVPSVTLDIVMDIARVFAPRVDMSCHMHPINNDIYC